jgi:hypothetical protein
MAQGPPDLNPDRKKLLDQLLKLLALSHSTTFAAEAATARAKAEELMRKHNLSLNEGSKDRTKFAIEQHSPWAKGAQWEYRIADTLGRLCGCEVYYLGDYQLFNLVGTVADLEALRYMIDAVNQQRIRAWLEYKRTGPDKLWSFSFSFAQALVEKVDSLLEGATEIEAQRERARLWFESSHKINHNDDAIYGRGASAAGRAAGSNTSLHRGVIGRPASPAGHVGYQRRLAPPSAKRSQT